MADYSGQERRKDDRRDFARRGVGTGLTLDEIFAEDEGKTPGEREAPAVPERRRTERRQQIRRADDRALHDLITGGEGG